MKTRNRIYYIPGIISLIALPIICYQYLIPYSKDERSLVVVFCEKYKPNKDYYNNIRFDTTFLSSHDDRRTYYTIGLNGNNKDDKTRLEFFRLLIRDLYNNKDTINGVHLLYGDTVKYKTFIESLNICKQESILIYIPFENNLWVLYKRFDKERLERIKVRREQARIKNNIEINNRSSDKLTIKDKFRLMIKIWPVFLLILLLGYLSLRKINKNTFANKGSTKIGV